MGKIIYVLVFSVIATAAMLSFSLTLSNAAAQSNNRGTQSGDHREIPGAQENVDPLAQAPITSLKVNPPNNASTAPPVEKDNIKGTSREKLTIQHNVYKSLVT
jgi:Flp pilus assembly protein TadG